MKKINFNKLLEFFQDNNGKMSNTRLGVFLIIITFIVDWWSHIIVLHKDFDPAWSIIGLVTAVLGLKVVNTKIEK